MPGVDSLFDRSGARHEHPFRAVCGMFSASMLLDWFYCTAMLTVPQAIEFTSRKFLL